MSAFTIYNNAADSVQQAETSKWVPWPEAHVDAAKDARSGLWPDVEAAECWRSAIRSQVVANTSNCFFRHEMEKAGIT